MGAAKLLWECEIERAAEDFLRDSDAEAFRKTMVRLGFDPDEIEDHLEALQS